MYILKPKIYNGKARITVYLAVDAFNALEAEREKTGETQSGIVASIVECFVTEMRVMANE
jgi:hypothetical protein